MSNTQFAHIARETDFNDFIRFQTDNGLRELEVRLASAVRKLAGSRTAVTEFLERRLTEVRFALRKSEVQL